MKRPKKTFPFSPGHMPPRTPSSLPDPSIDPKAFEELIKNRGLRWKLEKATFCPCVTDIETMQSDPNCTTCENGMIYYTNCEIRGVMQMNKLERIYEINGLYDLGEAVVTFSAYSDGSDGTPGAGRPIDLMTWDRLTCLDYEGRWMELVEHSPLGIDRLRYPATSIEYVASKTKTYYVDIDFFINKDGYIQWKNENQPSYDQLNQRGEVITVSYCYNPRFLVVQLLHEIRATIADDPATGKSTAVRLPQQVYIRRDYLFRHPSDKRGMPSTRFPRGGGTIVPQ